MESLRKYVTYKVFQKGVPHMLMKPEQCEWFLDLQTRDEDKAKECAKAWKAGDRYVKIEEVILI